LFLFDDDKIVFSCYTLELEWDNNQRNVSCIPRGIYKAKKRFKVPRGWHLHILDVEDRDWILIHKGNFNYDISGCILVGAKKYDLNNDGLFDVVDSTMTMSALMHKIEEEETLIEIL